jgi:hypothetical protein
MYCSIHILCFLSEGVRNDVIGSCQSSITPRNSVDMTAAGTYLATVLSVLQYATIV